MRALATIVILACAVPAAAQQYRHPSTCQDGCMTVTAYYDYAGPGATQDWSCGTRTYDGHRGTDFGTYGSWAAVDEGREVVAAADGEVIAAHDGEFDRCTSGSCSGGGGFGNYVAIRHADGKVTYYGHMRNGSVAVGVGARVTCGQRVGMIASSGYSTGPHLHFEPRVGGTTADDPFGMGGCSGPLSYWVSQGAYRALPAQTCESTAPASVDGATVASVEPGAGARVAAGSEVRARIVMHNAGTTTWRDGDQHLLTFDGGERMEAPDQVRLTGDVAPGADHAFELTLRAPADAGEHVARFRMDRYGTARFGDVAEVRVVVDAAPVDEDAGPPPIDQDAGAAPPEGDATVAPRRDGGAPLSGRDAGTRPRDEELIGTCSAAPGARGGALWLALAALAQVWRHRRERATSAR